ncbi:MAG TPA: hypothetical protein VJU84_20095 [Pyrinomonadaceae bacterium]|nr:hypothetical protein [Pyrinomonadaceae bacterium]
MSRLFIILVTVLCLPAFAETIQACQCREYGTPTCAKFWRSDAVFVGQVVDVKPLQKKPDNVYSYVMVRFIVQESFRGVSGTRVGVATATTMCDTTFKKGKRYLVFASLDDDTNQLFTGMCRGTTLISDTDDLNELRKLKQREAGESISGRIVTNRYKGLPGMTVEVTGNDKTLKTMTTKYGEFSLPMTGSGSFTVRVSVPYAVQHMMYSNDDLDVRSVHTESVSTFEYDVTLQKSECSYLEIDVHGTDPRATAAVAGNVLTATGEAVAKGAISLINDLETGPDYVEHVQKDGSFRFEGVAPGEYHLVLNAGKEVPAEFDAPYARTYFPATEDKSEAKKISVTEGAVIESLSMRVGRRMSERTVAGKVVWNGGLALEDAYLAVYSGDEYVRRVEIEDDGTFKFILYGDFAYSIEARDFIDEIEGRSQRITIPQGNSAQHKLVIRRIKP